MPRLLRSVSRKLNKLHIEPRRGPFGDHILPFHILSRVLGPTKLIESMNTVPLYVGAVFDFFSLDVRLDMTYVRVRTIA
jgi:hypothetical protein